MSNLPQIFNNPQGESLTRLIKPSPKPKERRLANGINSPVTTNPLVPGGQ